MTKSAPTPADAALLHRRRRRRCTCVCCALLAVLLLLGAVVVTLALTVFKIREPSVTIVFSAVEGVAPRIILPAVRVEINATLDLDLLVRNPNVASFSHGDGTAELFYRGIKVGGAVVAPGEVPARGSGHVHSRLTLEAERLATDMGDLLRDVQAGLVGLDTTTRMPGRVKLLKFLTKHVVVYSYCHVGIGFPDLSVDEQHCRQKTKL